MSVQITQNNVLNIEVLETGMSDRVMPTGMQLEKETDSVKFLTHNGSFIEEFTAADVISVTDKDGIVTPIAGDNDLFFETLRDSFFFRASDPVEIQKKLDKETLDPQTVAGAVEFLQSITVPSGSLILGADGAKVSSAARSLLYTDARERDTLFTQYSFDNSGTVDAYQWVSTGVLSQVDVCPDSGDTLSDPQELAFSGATGDTLSVAFWIIPKTVGTLRIQSWEGTDDTGAVLSDTLFEITAPQIDVNTQLMLSPAQISEIGDMQFVRFSGIQLSGAVQSSGIFIGQNCIFLQSDVHILSKKDLVKQDGNLLDLAAQASPLPHKEGRIYYDGARDTLNFYNAISDMIINLPEESIQPVWNATGSTITNGQVVKLSGVVTVGIPNIDLALADTVADANASGVATHDIEDGTKGYITIIGSVGGVDTSSFSVGDLLFLSNSTAGGLENVEQQILNPIALCLVSDSTEGIILVKPRGVINITAIAQAGISAIGVTQVITTTPAPVAGYGNTALPSINIDAIFTAGSGQFECKFQPSSVGASGFYEVSFNVAGSYTSNNILIFTVYLNGVATNTSSRIDLNNPQTDDGAISFTAITPEVVDNTESVEIYVSADAGTGTWTYESLIYSVKRIGNA